MEQNLCTVILVQGTATATRGAPQEPGKSSGRSRRTSLAASNCSKKCSGSHTAIAVGRMHSPCCLIYMFLASTNQTFIQYNSWPALAVEASDFSPFLHTRCQLDNLQQSTSPLCHQIIFLLVFHKVDQLFLASLSNASRSSFIL